MKFLTRSRAIRASLSLSALLVLAGSASADTANLSPIRDNTLIETPVNNSNGSGDGFYAGRVGTNGGGTRRRGLIAFDVSSIPAGSTVDAVTLTLECAQSSPIGGVRTVTLHRVNAAWGEAGSLGAGGGSPAQDGDATWGFRFFNTDTWTVPGGDFVALASASQSVEDFGPYTWTGAGLVADVQSWVDNPSTNFGWLVMGAEDVIQTSKKFYSKEGFLPPKLAVDYTPSAVGVPQESGAGDATFAAPWPSPAAGRVNLGYTLPQAARVSLAIYDAAGRVVRHLVSGAIEPAGRRTAVWDGRTNSGTDAASGVYLARLVVGGTARQRRIAMVR